MPIEGTGCNGVLIYSPTSEPLDPSSKGGAILERAIRKLGLTRDSFLIQDGGELGGYAPSKPRAILALGDGATQLATGTAHPVEMVEGYVLPPHVASTVSGVVPTFHPATLRGGKMNLFGCLLRDIGLALLVAKGEIHAIAPEMSPLTHWAAYREHPTEEDVDGFFFDVCASTRPIAYDIETPYSGKNAEEEELDTGDTILSIQFSSCSGSGIYLPWREPYIALAKKILALPNPKIGWNNWRFDNPRLAANGCVINGTNHDLMWMWHHLQPDLPRSLQFAAKFFGWPWPWKHLAKARPEFYGIVDVDVLTTIYSPLENALIEAGIYTGYERQVLWMEPILADMSARGMPIDRERYDQLATELDYQVTAGLEALQELVPEGLLKFKHYGKKKPKPIEGTRLLPIATTKGDPSTAMGWTRYWDWKPSHQALRRYATIKGHELPVDSITRKVTFDQLHLKRLHAKTKDPLYKAIIDYKDAATVLHSHISNWEPGPDGRVHSTFYYAPATGQLSSKRPNIQNAPRHKGDLFRSIVRATEGRQLIEFDYRSFHALTLGFEAGDLDYMRLARLDIHSYVTSHLLKLAGRDALLGLPDDALADQLSDIKRSYRHVRDRQAKPAILGYGFGLGYRKLYEMNRESFDGERDAKKLLEMLDALFPRTAAWRESIRIKAHTQGYLLSRYGYIRRFYEVLKWTPRGFAPGGEQSEAAIAFLPANDAFGRIKQAIRCLASSGQLAKYGFINTIHDSLLFECPIGLTDECICNVWRTMELPSAELEELVCEVSCSIGLSWDKMYEVSRKGHIIDVP